MRSATDSQPDKSLQIPDLRSQKDTYWKRWLQVGWDANKLPGDGDPEVAVSVRLATECGLFARPTVISPPPLYFDQVLNYAGHALRTAVDNNAWVPLFKRMTRLTRYEMEAMGDEPREGMRVYDVMREIRSAGALSEEAQGWPEPMRAYVADVRRRLGACKGTWLHDEYGKRAPFETIFAFNAWMQGRFEVLHR